MRGMALSLALEWVRADLVMTREARILDGGSSSTTFLEVKKIVGEW